MRSHFRSNVVGYLALVVALSGTSYAAVQLSAGQVQTKHLANGAVTSKKIKNHTVRAIDLKAGVVKNASVILAKTNFGLAPEEPPEVQSSPTEFTVPRTGKVYLRFFQPAYSAQCTNGAPVSAIYVDGKGVPGSASFGALDPAKEPLESVGVIRLTKGTHEYRVGQYCLGEGTWEGSSSSLSSDTWTILLLE